MLEEEIEALHDEAFHILLPATFRPTLDIGRGDRDKVSGTLTGMVDADLAPPALTLLSRAHHNHRAEA